MNSGFFDLAAPTARLCSAPVGLRVAKLLLLLCRGDILVQGGGAFDGAYTHYCDNASGMQLASFLPTFLLLFGLGLFFGGS